MKLTQKAEEILDELMKGNGRFREGRPQTYSYSQEDLLAISRNQSPRAAIMNVSSIAGFLPIPNTAVYAASKAYVTSLTEALRAELRDTGITVTTVCPGPVDTEFGDVAERGGAKHLPPPAALKISAAQVASEALLATANDRARVAPGLLTTIAAIVICALPMFIIRFLINRAARARL